MNTEPTTQSELAHILKNTLLPRVERDGMAKVFMAYPKWRPDMDLPEGMTATRKPLRGMRVPAPARRYYGKVSIIEARWPEDNLYSMRTPKLCFVLSGPLTLQIANYEVHCLPGHGILLPAGIPFATSGDSSSQHPGVYETLQMMPYHDGLLCWFTHRQQERTGVAEQTYSVPHSQVTFYLHQLAEEAAKHASNQVLICDSLLKIALALLQREMEELPVLRTGEISLATGMNLSGQMANPIKQAQKYIEVNLRKPLTIGKVAHYVCMSRTLFTTQFRAKTGKTLTRYVQDMRLEEAREFLLKTDLGVHDIAAAVGLKPNRMRELFHERDGISPLEFRQRSRDSSTKN